MQDAAPQDSQPDVAGAPSTEAPPLAPPPPKSGVTTGFLAVGGLILFALVGGLLAVRARKKLLGKDDASQSSGLLLDDMRAMLKRGEISPEEFEATKRTLSARMRAASPREPDRKPRG